MTFCTWASHRYVQELADILVSQNRIQGDCGLGILEKPCIDERNREVFSIVQCSAVICGVRCPVDARHEDDISVQQLATYSRAVTCVNRENCIRKVNSSPSTLHHEGGWMGSIRGILEPSPPSYLDPLHATLVSWCRHHSAADMYAMFIRWCPKWREQYILNWRRH